MGAVLLGQQEWGLGEKYGCPTKYGVWSRGPAGVMFLAGAPIFSYWGLSRGPAGIALINLGIIFLTHNKTILTSLLVWVSGHVI